MDFDLLNSVDDRNASFSSALSATSAISGSSSSKAVLAALRALQDKIRRLETERSQALDESAQLRLQLKNQEIEWEHAKQREQLSSQRSLQEAKAANERLLQDKNELEMKLMKVEEKNQQLVHASDELSLKIRLLEEEKHASALKIKELEHQQAKIEHQISLTQLKEKEMAESLVRDNRRHEEEMSVLQERLAKAHEVLASYTQEKGGLEVKLSELDQLVSQLLVLNESLVSQLANKPLKSAKSPSASSATKKKVKKTTKTSSAVKDVSSAAKSVLANSLKTDNVEQLKAMHKMYAGMAKSLIRSESPRKKASKSPLRGQLSVGGTFSATKLHDTRIGRKKSSLSSSANGNRFNSFDDLARSNMSSSSTFPRDREVRIPKPGVTFDQSYDSDFQTTRSHRSDYDSHAEDEFATRQDFHDYLSRRHAASSSSPSVFRSSIGSTASTRQEKVELQEIIAGLEADFDSLNNQYRKLLNNVSAASSATPSSTSPSSIQQQAEDIVNVIQKLHEKGEQLRQLKSPIKS